MAAVNETGESDGKAVLPGKVKRLRHEHDPSPIGSATLSQNGRILSLNAAAAKILGRPAKKVQGSLFSSFVKKNDQSEFRHHLRLCAGIDAQVTSQLELTPRLGGTHVELVSVPMRDPLLQKRVYRTAIFDITKRREMEKALHESENRYRELVELSPDAIFVHSEGRFVFANNAALELFGSHKREDLIGLPIMKIIHPDFKNVVKKRIARLRSSGREVPNMEQKLLRLDGSVVDVDVKSGVLSYGGKPAIQVIVRDVSQRKRAETLLLQAEERFSKAFEASPVAISITTVNEGRFIDVNRAFLRLYGFQREEVIGRTIYDIPLHPDPEDRRKIVQELVRRHSVSDHEMKLRTREGTTIDVIESLELIELGGEKCALTLWEDVTEKRRLEKEILEISELEQSRVGQDLHDGICQDLAGVAFLSEWLANSLANGRITSTDAAEEAGRIARHIKQAIDDAHGLATGLYPVRLEENGLASALQTLAFDISEIYHIRCVFKQGKSFVEPGNNNATHIYRIAREAVANAVKHASPKSIAIFLGAVNGHAELKVTDDGTGMKPRKNSKQPGMGLKTMNYRARMIGGSLEISPRAGRGTCVRLRFPIPRNTI